MNKNQLPEEQQPFAVPAVEACYNAEGLPIEYVGNPFIETLLIMTVKPAMREKISLMWLLNTGMCHVCLRDLM